MLESSSSLKTRLWRREIRTVLPKLNSKCSLVFNGGKYTERVGQSAKFEDLGANVQSSKTLQHLAFTLTFTNLIRIASKNKPHQKMKPSARTKSTSPN